MVKDNSKSLVEESSYIWKGSPKIFKKEIAEAIKRDRCDARMLKTLGFEQQTGSHDKYVLNGDDRYILTISNSPSDYRSGENLVHEAINLLFGRTK